MTSTEMRIREELLAYAGTDRQLAGLPAHARRLALLVEQVVTFATARGWSVVVHRANWSELFEPEHVSLATHVLVKTDQDVSVAWLISNSDGSTSFLDYNMWFDVPGTASDHPARTVLRRG